MATLTTQQIADLLRPYGDFSDVRLLGQLSIYLDLLLRWNEKTNLTAIRQPEEIVRRHFGESLFAGRNLPAAETLLDFGSGAGFPGLPIQLLKPDLRVTLAESQHKKAAFLRECVRTMALKTEVWSDRVEAMPADRCFDLVALRAVDRPDVALRAARMRVKPNGMVVHLTSGPESLGLLIPETQSGRLHMFHVEHPA